MKRGLDLLKAISGLFAINFVSAISYGSYFSLSDFLTSFDESTIILTGVFLIVFAVINTILSKAKLFKSESGEPNKVIIGVISFVMSTFVIYGLNKTGFDVSGLFFSIGISSDLLYPIVFALLVAGFIFLSLKFTFTSALMSLGGFLILAGFLIYEGESMIFYGLILFLVGAILKWKGSKKKT